MSGGAEPGSTVIITDGDGSPIGETTTDDDGNWTLTPDEPLPDGTAIEVVAQDPAGNISEPTTGNIDATAPATPVIDPTNGETLIGTAEPGSTITLTDGDGNVMGEAITDDNGNWSFQPDEPLADGTEVNATATDAAGNVSDPASTIVGGAIVDNTPPAAPTDVTVADDGTTVTGTAEPGSTVTIEDADGNPLGSVIANDDGSFSVPLDPALTNGEDVTATATDAVGNESDPTSATAPDLTAPDAPTDVTVADDGTAVTGAAEPGSTVTISDTEGNPLGSVIANDDGSFSVPLDPALTNGEDVTATATDAVGNESDTTSATAPDLTAPDAPTDVTVADDGNAVTGTAEPGSTVTINDADGNPLGSVIANDDGSFSVPLDPALTNGEDVTATATDDAGNESDPTGATAPDVNDNTPPATPTIGAANDDIDPQIGGLDNGDSTNDATPTLSGRAEAGSTVAIYAGDDVLDTVIADDQGNWSYTPDALDDGDYAFTVTATDSTGNVSNASDSFTLIIDTQPPTAPVVNPTDGQILTGSAEAGSTVTLTDVDDNVIATVTSDINGNWSFAPETPLPDDTTFNATATDAAGNISQPGSASVDANLEDTLPPSEPVIITSLDAAAPVTGNVDNGGTTNDPNPTLVGTAEATNTVQVWADDGSNMQMLGSTQADNFGNWSFRIFSRLADGNTTFRAISIDPAGQESATSSSYAVVVDTTPPDAPTIDSATDDVDPTGMLDDGDSTNDTTPALTGTAEANATVTISANGAALGSITADGDGNWSFTPEALNEGDVTFTATATDAAGNVSPISDGFTLTLDETAPDAGDNSISINDGGDGALNVDEAGGVTLTGRIESGASVTGLTISDGADGSIDVPLENIDVDANGNLTVSGVDLSSLSDGELTATLYVTDAAGNTGTVTDTTTLDSVAPDAPTAALANDTATGDDGITSDATVNVGGLEDGATWEYTTDGGSTWIDGTGASFELPEGIYADGDVQVHQTDAAGNTSDTGNLGTVAIDLTAPEAPVIEGAEDDIPSPGPIDDGETTNDVTPTLIGSAEANAIVTVYADGRALGTTSADDNGDWQFATDEEDQLFGGETVFTATATDVAGNVSATSPTFTLTFDTTAPAAPVIDPTDGDEITGTAEPGSTVTLTDGDDNAIGTVTADPDDGSWSFTPDEPLPDGTEVNATATDASGNTSPEATVTVDAT
ncbi:Ig-like domain-containing protein, partial [Salinicola halimionae]|uniref:Ig-like domain-containing protein n=1 Tax=Salinicola halimionae TaxID=1949081 RepID=UPI001FD993EB